MSNRMKNKFYAICGLGLVFFSCQKGETAVGTYSDRSIYLQASVENTLDTRAPFYLSQPDLDNPLKVAVWASTTANVFEDLGANGTGADKNVALHTTANFTNGKEQLLNDAVYPDDPEKVVYFVGMHPESGWTAPETGDTAGKTASKTFNGSEDVMFAPQISGKYAHNTETDTWPTFQFHHLLTWLKVSVKADGQTVSDAWGKLKSLKIRSTNGVTVDLGRDYERNCVSFSGEAELDFYKKGTDKVFADKDNESTWYALPVDKAEEVAYVLCGPVAATAKDPESQGDVRTTEYTLIVETENRKVEVPVDLMTNADSYFDRDTMRYQFILNLNFKMGSNIAVTAAIADWGTGGLGSGELDPNI